MGCIIERPINNFNFISAQAANGVDIADLTGSIDNCSLFLSPPINLVSSSITNSSFTVTATSQSGGLESGFEWQASELVDFSVISDSGTSVGGDPTPSFDFTGLSPDTLYYVRARANGAINSAWSSEIQVTTLFAFSFQTDMVGGGTFDPSIVYSGSGTPQWIFEDGSVETGDAISVTGSSVGLDGTSQTVLLVLEDKSQITAIIFSGLDLLGSFNLNEFTGATFSNVDLRTNSLTSFNKSGITFGLTSELRLNSNNLTSLSLSSGDEFKTLDASNNSLTSISNLNNSDFGNSATLGLSSNPSLGLSQSDLPSSITGAFVSFKIDNTGYSGSVDLSAYDYWIGTSISIRNNSSLTSATYPDMSSGTVKELRAENCDLSGSQDLSNMIINDNNAMYFTGNSSLTGWTPPSNYDTALWTYIAANDTNISSIDFSDYDFGTSGSVRGLLFSGSPLTSITFTAITGTLTRFQFNNCSVNNFNVDDLGSGAFDVSGCQIDLNDQGFTATETNRFLVQLDSITANVGTGKSLLIAGTNAAPDGSSGGFDGDAAVTSLISKGFTVTTS